ncbi:sensor histidine kinase [Curtobacterium sp. RRHDQ10]|uniref:sensor histidine kinase n=1 Tax=Curtobacterium phyllosphaerae TaxID=3413379 RepID=UPI003BF23B10
MLGIPTHLAPRVNAWSMVRSFHAGAIAALAATAALLVVYRIVDPHVHVMPAVLALVPTTLMMAVHTRIGTWRSAAAFLLVGGVCAAWFAAVVESQLGGTEYIVSFLISLAIVPLVLVGGAGTVPARVIAWSVLGFAVGRVATMVGAATTGRAYEPVVLAWVTLVLVVGIVGIGTRVTGRLHRVQPEFLRSAREEHVAATRRTIELEAAAILHDTVLNHLAAIANAPDGPADAYLTRALDDDFTMLSGRQWLVPQTPTAAEPETAGALADAVEHAGRDGLEVELTGDATIAVRLDPEIATALGRAVGQCLANVRKHAETDRAEVSVFDDGATCTVMVVDDGRGFDESATGADRLGLKNSVRQRIERVGGSVQVWSSPGTGTSVMMSVPFHASAHGGSTVVMGSAS